MSAVERLLDRVGAIATSKSARAALVVSQRRRLADASNTLWFKPTLAVFGALTLGLIFSRAHAAPGSLLWPLAFHGTSEDSRQVLTVIIGALIPVTSLTFALTVVTLQIASTQFSPRLLRTFLRDNRTQLVLSGLMGTVAYSVAGLFTVNTGVTATDEVPRLAISLALALALGCLGLLIYYFGHITNAVRIDTIMRHVESDTRAVIDLEHPRLVHESSDADREEIASSPAHAVMVTSPLDGYVQGVDPRLAELAVRKRVTVQVLPLIGYYTMVGRPLAQVWTDDGSDLLATTRSAIRNMIEIDPERRVERDVGLGLRQLVDIVNRAMSTGQNDPYTATQAVHHLTTALVDAIDRSFATRVFHDASGMARVIVPIMSFPTHLKVVCGQIRQGGLERHPRVMLELLRMLGTLADEAPTRTRAEAVRREVQILITDAQRMIPSPTDLEEALKLGDDVLARVAVRNFESGSPP